MSISYFVSIVSWASFFALMWLLVLNYLENGTGTHPGAGLILFFLLGCISGVWNMIPREGGEEQDES